MEKQDLHFDERPIRETPGCYFIWDLELGVVSISQGISACTAWSRPMQWWPTTWRGGARWGVVTTCLRNEGTEWTPTDERNPFRSA